MTRSSIVVSKMSAAVRQEYLNRIKVYREKARNSSRSGFYFDVDPALYSDATLVDCCVYLMDLIAEDFLE